MARALPKAWHYPLRGPWTIPYINGTLQEQACLDHAALIHHRSLCSQPEDYSVARDEALIPLLIHQQAMRTHTGSKAAREAAEASTTVKPGLTRAQ